jgi:hypothetical protein
MSLMSPNRATRDKLQSLLGIRLPWMRAAAESRRRDGSWVEVQLWQMSTWSSAGPWCLRLAGPWRVKLERMRPLRNRVWGERYAAVCQADTLRRATEGACVLLDLVEAYELVGDVWWTVDGSRTGLFPSPVRAARAMHRMRHLASGSVTPQGRVRSTE